MSEETNHTEPSQDIDSQFLPQKDLSALHDAVDKIRI